MWIILFEFSASQLVFAAFLNLSECPFIYKNSQFQSEPCFSQGLIDHSERHLTFSNSLLNHSPMSFTLRNIIQMLNKNDESILSARLRQTESDSSSLGPNDLVLITWIKEHSVPLVSFPSKKQTYFHVRGIDTSSPASIGVFICSLLKEQEKGSWLGGNWRVSMIKFCVFDAIEKIDVRLDFRFPGSQTLSANNLKGEEIDTRKLTWESIFISSVLRYIACLNSFPLKHFPFLKNEAELNAFLSSLEQLFGSPFHNMSLFQLSNNNEEIIPIEHDNFVLKDIQRKTESLFATRGNQVLSMTTDFLINSNNLTKGIEFFAKMFARDERYLVFLLEIFMETELKNMATQVLSKTLSLKPNIFILVFKQAQLLSAKESHKEAIQLLRYVIEVFPNSFECWSLLVENLIGDCDYLEALRVMNSIPFNLMNESGQDPKKEDSDFLELVGLEVKMQNPRTVNPKLLNTISVYPNYYSEPVSMDFKFTKVEEEINFVQSGWSHESTELNLKYSQLPGKSLDTFTRRLFDFFVKIEKDIGWERLLYLKLLVFHRDDPFEIPKKPLSSFRDFEKEAEETKAELDKQQQETLHDEDEENQITTRKIWFAEELSPVKKRKSDNKDVEFEKDQFSSSMGATNMLMEDSMVHLNEKSENLPNFLGDSGSPVSRPRKLESERTMEIRKGMEKRMKVWSEHENVVSYLLDAGRVQTNLMRVREVLRNSQKYQKRQEKVERALSDLVSSGELNKKEGLMCSKEVEEAFEALKQDINEFSEWNSEVKKCIDAKMPPIPFHSYDGIVWVQRGALSERLDRLHWAEMAFMHALQTGGSLYAIRSLLKIYSEVGNFRAMVFCASAFLEGFKPVGCCDLVSFPSWVESCFFKAIRRYGVKGLVQNLEQEQKKEEAFWSIVKREAESNHKAESIEEAANNALSGNNKINKELVGKEKK